MPKKTYRFKIRTGEMQERCMPLTTPIVLLTPDGANDRYFAHYELENEVALTVEKCPVRKFVVLGHGVEVPDSHVLLCACESLDGVAHYMYEVLA